MQGYISRGLGYTTFIIAAAVAISEPAPSLIGVSAMSLAGLPLWLSAIAPIAWSALLLVSSAACLLGVLTRTWVGEYVGLPALMIALLTLAVAQLAVGYHFMAFLVIGGVCALWYRLYIVLSERRAAVQRFKNFQQFKDYQKWKDAI